VVAGSWKDLICWGWAVGIRLPISKSEVRILLGAPPNQLVSPPATTLHRQFPDANPSSFSYGKTRKNPD